MEDKRRVSGWFYVVAAVMPVAGCLLAMVLIAGWFPGLPGALETRVNMGNLTQVVVPGTSEITFDKRGAYAVYYEHRSIVAGTVYATSERPPVLACTLTSRTSGDEVGVVPDYVASNAYSTKDGERVGRLIRSITIKEPGRYIFSCGYADGSPQPEVVLAVGPNLAWEFLGIAARTIVVMAAGLAVLLGSGILAAVVVTVVALKRHRPNRGASRA